MRRIGMLAVLLVATACGCGRQDVDRLARVGRAAGAKFQGLTSVAQQRLPPGLREMHLSTLDTLEGRVEARLRWDRALAELNLEVRAEAGTVELRGTVPDVTTQRLAVHLAETTVGVESVKDSLSVAAR